MWAKIAIFIVGLMPNLVGKILFALGFGTVSYLALNTLANQFIAHVVSSMGQIGSTTLQILNICGLSAAVSIICSAIITKAALMAVTKLSSMSLGNGVTLPRW